MRVLGGRRGYIGSGSAEEAIGSASQFCEWFRVRKEQRGTKAGVGEARRTACMRLLLDGTARLELAGLTS